MKKNNINIERSILSSFLWANDVGTDTSYAFKLDEAVFTGDRKLIARAINQETDTEGRYYGLLNMRIENSLNHEWIELSMQTPTGLSFAKKNYEYILADYRLRRLRREV